MTDGPTPDPSRVLVNGAAVSLIATLVDGLRRDLGVSEERLTRRIEGVFDHHVEAHEVERVEDLEFRRRVRERLAALEQSELDEQLADAEAKGLRTGRWQFLKAVQVVLRDYGWQLAALLFLALSFVSAALGGIRLHFGP